MSTRRRAPYPPDIIDRNSLQKALHGDNDLADAVRRILSVSERDAKGFIGNTSITAYRRIHEVITSVLDRIIEVIRGGTPRVEELSKFMVELSRCLILVRFQLARNQISQKLADKLIDIINIVMNNVKEAKDFLNVVQRARTLLDALAVLVYERERRR